MSSAIEIAHAPFTVTVGPQGVTLTLSQATRLVELTHRQLCDLKAAVELERHAADAFEEWAAFGSPSHEVGGES